MPKKKKRTSPAVAEPVTETEVSIGGEHFRVTVRSTAKLDKVAAQSQALFRSCAPSTGAILPMGFAGPGAAVAEISEPVGQSLLGLDGN